MEKHIPVTDLIHMFTGKFATNKSLASTQSMLVNHCDKPSIWELSLWNTLLDVLVLKLERTTGQRTTLKSPIRPEKEIDVSSLCMKKHGTKMVYTSGAVVCHHAPTTDAGHYTAHIMTEDNMVKSFIDSKRPQAMDMDTLFAIDSISSSTHLLFYFLKSERISRAECPSAVIFRKTENC